MAKRKNDDNVIDFSKYKNDKGSFFEEIQEYETPKKEDLTDEKDFKEVEYDLTNEIDSKATFDEVEEDIDDHEEENDFSEYHDEEEIEEILEKQSQILSFEKEKKKAKKAAKFSDKDIEGDESNNRNSRSGVSDKVSSFIGSAILLIGVVLIFAAAIYARYRMDSASRNKEGKDNTANPPTATESNADGKKADYSWWYERDVSETAQLATASNAEGTLEIGTRTFFGTYKQGPGGESTDIAWLVLDVDDNSVLVVSEYILDAMPYSTDKVCQWENSTIRAWLADDFYNSAFAEQEKEFILTFEIENEDNPLYNISGGHDTDDAIFLLSIEDINDYFDEVEKKSRATPYTLEKGIASGGNTYATYWLRSPGSMDIIGSEPGYAANVDYAGEIKYFGNDVTFDVIGVRPAMWVSTKAFEK